MAEGVMICINLLEQVPAHHLRLSFLVARVTGGREVPLFSLPAFMPWPPAATHLTCTLGSSPLAHALQPPPPPSTMAIKHPCIALHCTTLHMTPFYWVRTCKKCSLRLVLLWLWIMLCPRWAARKKIQQVFS